MLVAAVDIPASSGLADNTLEVWNVGIINGANWGEEKVSMLETVYGRIYLQTTKTDTSVLLGGYFNPPKQQNPDGSVVPHGKSASQYTAYPDYGNPHYLRASDGEIAELEFKQRRQLAEARIFDLDAGDWGLQDV